MPNRPFLSTLSLRRATSALAPKQNATQHFYPRSPCGERRPASITPTASRRISIHALLAESDGPLIFNVQPRRNISIHALLAESDAIRKRQIIPIPQFLSTLSLRRATRVNQFSPKTKDISIHALLAESDRVYVSYNQYNNTFLSTLSLRRATDYNKSMLLHLKYFYPRSPCGERQRCELSRDDRKIISIHALLAESDRGQRPYWGECQTFLSTLSLRRAT